MNASLQAGQILWGEGQLKERGVERVLHSLSLEKDGHLG